MIINQIPHKTEIFIANNQARRTLNTRKRRPPYTFQITITTAL